jgi:hypothetical protein
LLFLPLFPLKQSNVQSFQTSDKFQEFGNKHNQRKRGIKVTRIEEGRDTKFDKVSQIRGRNLCSISSSLIRRKEERCTFFFGMTCYFFDTMSNLFSPENFFQRMT